MKVQAKYLIKFHNPWWLHHNSSYVIVLIRFAKLLQLNQSDFIDTQTNAKYLQIKQNLDCVHIFRVMPSNVIEQSQLGQMWFLITIRLGFFHSDQNLWSFAFFWPILLMIKNINFSDWGKQMIKEWVVIIRICNTKSKRLRQSYK